MKRTIAYLLAVMLFVCIMPLGIYAAETPTIDIANVSGENGKTVDVAVNLKNNPGISSCIVDMYYDDTALSYVSAEYGKEFLKPITNAMTDEDGKAFVRFTWVDGIENVTGDRTFVTVVFKINNDAEYKSYPLTIKYDAENVYQVVDYDYENVTFAVSNGSITVADNRPEITGLSMTDAEFTYDGTAKTIAVAGTQTGDTVTYTTTMDGKEVSGGAKSAGTYTVTATVERDGCKPWTGSATLTINPKEVTVSVPTVESKPYDGETAADEIRAALDAATVEGVETGDEVNATFQNDWSVDAVNADKYSVTIGVSIDNPNYTLEKEEVTLNYEITKMPITVTIGNAIKIVGMDVPVLPYSFEPKVLVGESEIIGSPSVNVTEDVAGKTYDITEGDIRVTPDPNNYTLSFENGTLTVSAKQPKKVIVTGKMEKTSFWEGETIDMTGITVSAEYENGDKENDVKTYTVYCDGTGSKAPEVDKDGTINVTIEYLGVKADWSQTVVIKDNYIDSITVDATNAKKVYLVGDTLSKDGLVVTGKYLNAEGNTAPKDDVTLTEDQYNLSAEMATKAESVEVTVTAFSRGDTYAITVMDKYLTGLKVVDTDPTSLSLIEGQTFKLSESDVDVKAVYSDGTEVSVKDAFSAVEITRDSVGSESETLSYSTENYGFYKSETKTCTLTVTFAKKSVAGIEVTKDPTKTDYFTGDKFDPAGAEIKLTYDNGKSETITKEYDKCGISFTPTKMEDDTTTVTVSCGSKTAQVHVTVIPKVLDSISVKPIKVTYVDGESFSKDDIEVTAKYNNGTTATVTDYTVDVDTFTLTNAAVAETVTVKVTYTEKGVEKSDTYGVTVNPCVAIVNGKHYADLNEAIENAKAGDTIEMPLPGEYDVDVDKDLTFKNTSGEDISMKINNEEVTIEANSSYEVEIKDEMDSTYFTFYLQMLQWRNRTFIVSYKQTEGGTISGANAARFSQSVTFTVTPDDGYAIADVLVNGKSVGAVDSYTIRSIKANTTVSATFEKLETEAVEIVPETTPWANPFTDVGEMDAFYVAVQYVYENGLFKGMSDTEFGPAITMNRAMFVTVLGRLTGVNVDDFTTVTFADCEAGSWYAPYVEWAAKSGIVNGMSATEFAPDAKITVEQALTILYRYMITMGYDLAGEADLTAYADAASVSDWATPAVQWAVANGIYEAADTLAPQTAAARSLVATLLYNLSGMLAK